MFDAGIPLSSFGHFIELSETRDCSPPLAESGAFSCTLSLDLAVRRLWGRLVEEPHLCMDVSGGNWAKGTPIEAWPCGTDDKPNKNQQWVPTQKVL